MNLDSHGRLIMISPSETTQNQTDQKSIKTRKNTVESPLKSLENSLVSTPIYNMRVTMPII
ncbi:hypothetical protein [Acinetobacter guillouiae]